MTDITLANWADVLPMRQILRRAVIIAGVLGSALTLINQPGAIFGASELKLLPLVLVYLTPFLVVAVSQGLGIRAARSLSTRLMEFREPFLQTLISHGIPKRAIQLGLSIGCTNAFIVTSATLLAGQTLDQLPVSLILQALTLPILFGALSQVLAFRRAIT